jgi:FixJ family two-component response regulator
LNWVAIVDDDESLRRCLSRVFAANGISARTFGSAESYLSQVGAGVPRCMVLDVHLGGINGFELQDRLRDEGRDPPIVFITGMLDVAEHLAARSVGGSHLRKPFDMVSLLELVRRHAR